MGKLINPVKTPRYDDIYRDGVKWLDSLQYEQQHCMFDMIPEEDKGKPMLLSCSCPKCSPRC